MNAAAGNAAYATLCRIAKSSAIPFKQLPKPRQLWRAGWATKYDAAVITNLPLAARWLSHADNMKSIIYDRGSYAEG